MDYYIHLADPSFPEPPWPGERRLGPYGSSAQAAEQAANDIAIGMGETIIGVYSEVESGKRDVSMQEGGAAPKLAVTREKLDVAAAKIREEINREQARVVEEQREALERLLPEGVSADEFLTALRGGK